MFGGYERSVLSTLVEYSLNITRVYYRIIYARDDFLIQVEDIT